MKKLEILPGEALLKETNYRNPFTDEYEYDGSMWVGKHLVCRFEEDCEDAPQLFLDAHNTYHANNMLPSEMAERIKALEEGLRDMVEIARQDEWDMAVTGRQVVYKSARALLTPPIDEAHGHLLSNPE